MNNAQLCGAFMGACFAQIGFWIAFLRTNSIGLGIIGCVIGTAIAAMIASLIL